MPEHAYRCDCGAATRVYFDLSQYPFPDELSCKCGGKLVRFFERAPGMQPDIWVPHYDPRIGAVVTSRAQRDRIAREKGFAVVGNEEFSRNARDAKEEDEFPVDSEKWRESAQKAWNDLRYGNVPDPGLTTVDTTGAVVSKSE